VRRILLDSAGAVAGVETDQGETIPLAAVVSGADAVRTHRELLGGPAAKRFERRRTYEPACSGVVLYLGLDRAYEHLTHHNFLFSRDPHEEFEAIYRQGIPAPDPTCYVCAPARTESTVAPPGGEALYVLVHTPYLRPDHDWSRLYPAYREVILRKLAETGGMKDLASRIRCEDRLTPQDIHDRYHVLNGAIYGLASHGRFFGAFKPANRSPDVAGLYLAGGAAHPGPGMPMVLMSGWIAADTLDRDGVVSRGGGAARERDKRDERDRKDRTEEIANAPRPTDRVALPCRSAWLVRLFTRYARSYVRRNFHAVRLARAGWPAEPSGEPLIIVLNHPSWWDPLLGVILAELFPHYRHYAPMDATGLAKYRVLERLGFFPVEVGSRSGALRFLRTAQAILAQPYSALWITAQGRFTDPRERPLQLREGVGHLVRRLEQGVILPLALEYPFWQERFPEALARFGAPLSITPRAPITTEAWMEQIERALMDAQDGLATLSMSRDPAGFETLLGGSTGVGGLYDLWRRFVAFWKGERFQSAHGNEPLGNAP
jgi:1-acyl-sn-glycerol-3-phosphate acyltransferase